MPQNLKAWELLCFILLIGIEKSFHSTVRLIFEESIMIYLIA